MSFLPSWDDGPDANAIMISLCVAAAEITQRRMQSAAEANVGAESSACGGAAVQKLLSIMSDAVVHLDVSLVVSPPPQALDALRLRTNAFVGINTGPYFPSLMSHGDEDRFMAFVKEGDGLGQSLHVHMRDDCAFLVDVELFHQRFEDVAGRSATSQVSTKCPTRHVRLIHTFSAVQVLLSVLVASQVTEATAAIWYLCSSQRTTSSLQSALTAPSRTCAS